MGTIIRPPEWRGRRRYWEDPKWGHTPELDVAVTLFRRQNEHGWVDKYYLMFKRLNEPDIQAIPVLAQSFLTTTGSNQTTNAGVDASWNNANNTIETIGAGAAGAHGASTTTGGGGGGGGAYNIITNFNISNPGTDTFTWRVGAGGLHGGTFPQNGGDTWFNDTAFPTTGTKVGSRGGSSPATNTTATGGVGGLAANGFPTTSPPARSGGSAANGTSQTVGGGGGGAGGPNGAGGNGSSNTGGTADGGTVAGGSPGNPGTSNHGTEFDATHGCGSGAGGSNASGGTGGNGGLYGGGAGGGSRSNGTGGDGAQGIIVLTWTPLEPTGDTRMLQQFQLASQLATDPPDSMQQQTLQPNQNLNAPPAPTAALNILYPSTLAETAGWLGAPMAAGALLLDSLAPSPPIDLTQYLTRAPIFVPKPPWEPPWGPGSVGPVDSLYTVAPTPFSIQWRYDLTPEPFWQGNPLNAYSVYIPPPPPPSNEWASQYTFEPDKYWQGRPFAVASLIFELTAGGQPFSKLWRWDYEPDKYWQGAPQATNIEFFPFIEPFSKLWRYDLITDTYWVGTPTSNRTPQAFAAPFSNEWSSQYTLDSDVHLWQRYSVPSNTLFVLVEGGQPFHKLWRYDHEPDKFWQGAPQATNAEFFPFIEPFSKEWRYDYVPSPDWLGTPIAVADPLFILTSGGPPAHKLWRYDFEPDKFWQGTPTFTQVPEELAKPFARLWRYDWDSDVKQWNWIGPPSNTLYALVEGGVPTSNEWFIQYTWNTEFPQWVGTPQAAASIYLTPIEPPHVQWAATTTLDSDIRLWQRYSLPTVTLFSLVEGGKPFSKLWRYDYFTEFPQWQGRPFPSFTLTDLAYSPKNKQIWRYDYASGETYWQGSPLQANIRMIPIVEPFSTEWTPQYTFEPDKFWQGLPQTAQTLRALAHSPFSNEWAAQYTFEPDKFWQGTPVPTNIRMIPFLEPFSTEWGSQYTTVPEPFWLGKPLISWTLRTPIFVPFNNEWSVQYTLEPDKYWQGRPLPANIGTIPRVAPFSNEWSAAYTNVPEPFWQARPIASQSIRTPILEPFSKNWTGQYTFEPDKFWLGQPRRTVTLTDLAVRPTSPTKQWHYDADFHTFWQGRPVQIPSFFIQPMRFVIDPDSLLPHVPIWPGRKEHLPWFKFEEGRKDPLPDEAIWPRRKDALVGEDDERNKSLPNPKWPGRKGSLN